MNTTTNQTLDIQGTQFNYAAASFKMALSAACIGLGIFLWPLREHTFWPEWDSPLWVTWDSPEAKSIAWLIAAMPLIIAAILPYQAHTFLDLGDSQLATLKYYGWFRISNRRRPLTDFGSIAVRHICHPGGEGPDTFTGSVGLKPTDEGAVFWLKEFSTTQDEMPREAYEFAITLQKSLPLPMTVLGLEFLDLEKTKFLNPRLRQKPIKRHALLGCPAALRRIVAHLTVRLKELPWTTRTTNAPIAAVCAWSRVR